VSYLTQGTIANNGPMHTRIAQCAAQQGNTTPDVWAADNARIWAAAPGWDNAWESAMVSHSGDPTYDPGADEAVITDAMILAQIQPMVTP
jgi:hypothetical protein